MTPSIDPSTVALWQETSGLLIVTCHTHANRIGPDGATGWPVGWEVRPTTQTCRACGPDWGCVYVTPPDEHGVMACWTHGDFTLNARDSCRPHVRFIGGLDGGRGCGHVHSSAREARTCAGSDKVHAYIACPPRGGRGRYDRAQSVCEDCRAHAWD